MHSDIKISSSLKVTGFSIQVHLSPRRKADDIKRLLRLIWETNRRINATQVNKKANFTDHVVFLVHINITIIQNKMVSVTLSI